MGWIKDLAKQPQKKPKYSQNGEEWWLKYIFDNIGGSKFVDLGAWDGRHLSNTMLLADNGWSGLLVDSKVFPGVYCSMITKENILETLRVNESVFETGRAFEGKKEFDLLSIDLDGNDYWILNEVLTKYSPRVIISEFNAEHPLNVAKTIQYDPDFAFDNYSDYYGYTYGAGELLAKEHGYTIIFQNSCLNLYYLRNDLVSESPQFDVKVYRHWGGVNPAKEWHYL